jgi:hypothetical protein
MELLGDVSHVEFRFGPFGDSVSVGARCWHGLHQTYQMKLLGDVDHVESHFSLFGDSVRVSARWVHGLHQMYHRLKNYFGCTRWQSKIVRLKWKFILVCLVILLRQDRCTVWTKFTTASKIILDAPDGTPR